MYGIVYGMRRTTLYLPDDLKEALQRTAAAEGRSEAEVVRSALATATAKHTRGTTSALTVLGGLDLMTRAGRVRASAPR